MPQVTMEESSGFDLHEADEWLPGEIVGIEETGDNGYGPGLKWIIRLDGEDGWDSWAYSSQKLSPRSKLYAWLKGLGKDPEVGEDIDLAQFEGTRVEVMFEHVERDGQLRDKVVKIRAEKKSGNSKPKAKPLKVVGPTNSIDVEDDEAPF